MSDTTPPAPYVPGSHDRTVHGIACGVVAAALVVIFLGANVTSTASGDAIPTWPHGLSFETAKEAVEMTHRVVAAVAILACAALWWASTKARELGRVGPIVVTLSRWAIGVVLVQAILGGIRIYVPAALLKVVHATGGQMLLCIAVACAVVTSPVYLRTVRRTLSDEGLAMLRASILSFIVLFVQLVLGALGRHDVIPREVHAAFAIVALLLAARMVLVATGDMPRDVEELRGPASLFGFFAALQLVLGIASYVIASDEKTADPEHRELGHVLLLNAHVLAASAMLGLNILLLLRTLALWGVPTEERVAEARRALDAADGGGTAG